MGARDGAVVRALASHQCGPGSNPGVDAICGLSLLLVLSFAPRGFSPGTPVFPSPQKPTFPNSNSIRNRVDEEPLCGCATSKSSSSSLLLLLLLLLEKRESTLGRGRNVTSVSLCEGFSVYCVFGCEATDTLVVLITYKF